MELNTVAGIVGVHEGAGSEIDGLARHRHVVGVHHAMNEAHVHPARDQRRLARGDGSAAAPGTGARPPAKLRVMTIDHVIGQTSARRSNRRARRSTRTCPRAHGSRQRASGSHPAAPLARPRSRRSHRRERPCRRNAQRMHGLADQILAQHRPQGRAPVAAARIGGASGALQLDVAAHARAVDQLRRAESPARRRAAARSGRIDGRHRPWRSVRRRSAANCRKKWPPAWRHRAPRQSIPSSEASSRLKRISLGLATGTGPCRAKKFAGSAA